MQLSHAYLRFLGHSCTSYYWMINSLFVLYCILTFSTSEVYLVADVWEFYWILSQPSTKQWGVMILWRKLVCHGNWMANSHFSKVFPNAPKTCLLDTAEWPNMPCDLRPHLTRPHLTFFHHLLLLSLSLSFFFLTNDIYTIILQFISLIFYE